MKISKIMQYSAISNTISNNIESNIKLKRKYNKICSESSDGKDLKSFDLKS